MKNKKFINKKPFFIAEISSNHCGSINLAKKLINDAKKYGFDAVKLQTYTADCMTNKQSKFKISHGLWKNKSLWKLYNKARTPLEWHKKLFCYAKKINMKIFSTPFSIKSLHFLENLKCPIYKVSSFEITDLELIKQIAKTKKPMIISTGLANLKEIKQAVLIAKKNGCKDLTLLYCVSNYPSNNSDFNINNLKILKNKFKCRIGLSDHSNSYIPGILSISNGAEVFEKHIASNSQKSFDFQFSSKGLEIFEYKKNIIEAYKMSKNNKFTRSKSEMANLIFRRSIYANQDIKKGETITKNNVINLRPLLGIPANYLYRILGKKLKKNVKKGRPINNSLFK